MTVYALPRHGNEEPAWFHVPGVELDAAGDSLRAMSQVQSSTDRSGHCGKVKLNHRLTTPGEHSQVNRYTSTGPAATTCLTLPMTVPHRCRGPLACRWLTLKLVAK